MKNSNQLTGYLSYCLLTIRVKHSDTWFSTVDCFPAIKRGDYNLGRLVHLGYLERKYENGRALYFLIA